MALGHIPTAVGRATRMLYFDALRDEQIAATLSVLWRTLAHWKRRLDIETAFNSASEVEGRLIHVTMSKCLWFQESARLFPTELLHCWRDIRQCASSTSPLDEPLRLALRQRQF